MGRMGTGVEMREHSIRVGFLLKDKWERETLQLEPTPANEKKAITLMSRVKFAVKAGTFTWAEFFPDSKRAAGESSGRQTFGRAADQYLESIGQLSLATRDQYANAVKVWKELLGADTDMDSITHATLKAKVGGGDWASARLLNNYLIPLRGIFAMVYHGPRAAANPMAGIENSKVVKKPPDPLTRDERDKILGYLAKRYDKRVWAYFAFAFYTGMRPEEIIALQWGDIDFGTKVAHIARVRTFRGSERDGSKTHTERDVELVGRALEALEAMRPYTGGDGSRDVFQNPVTRRAWHDERSQREHYWHPALDALGIRRRRPYSTRHTYATIALAGNGAGSAGANPNYVARQLGHANTRMLFQTYSKWLDGQDKGTERAKMELAFA